MEHADQQAGLDEDAFQKLRLALAAAQFTDAAFTYGGGWAPEPVHWREGDVVRVFDELWRGTAQLRNWLGRPDGPAVHLAVSSPDLLDARDASGHGGREGTTVDTGAPLRTRSLGSVELTGPDLFVQARMSARPLASYPPEIARRVAVRATHRGAQPARTYTWVDGEPRISTFAFHGIHLTDLLPGQRFHRFQGTEQQDPITNKPAGVERDVRIGPLDALFLVRQDSCTLGRSACG